METFREVDKVNEHVYYKTGNKKKRALNFSTLQCYRTFLLLPSSIISRISFKVQAEYSEFEVNQRTYLATRLIKPIFDSQRTPFPRCFCERVTLGAAFVKHS